MARRTLLIACAVARASSVCYTCSDIAKSRADLGTDLGASCPGPAENTCCVRPCPEGQFCIQSRDASELPCPSAVPDGGSTCSVPSDWPGPFECLYDPIECNGDAASCTWTTKATCTKQPESTDYTWEVMMSPVICPEEECPSTMATGGSCTNEGQTCQYGLYSDECTEPFYMYETTCVNGEIVTLVRDPIPCYCPDDFPTAGEDCDQRGKTCGYGENGCEAICDRDTGTWLVTEQTGCDEEDPVQPSMCYSCDYMAENQVAGSCSAAQVATDCCSPCGPDSEICIAGGDVGVCPLEAPGKGEACSDEGLVCMFDAMQCASIFFTDKCGFGTTARCKNGKWKVKSKKPCRVTDCEDPKYTTAKGKKRSCGQNRKKKCHKPGLRSKCPNLCKPECALYDGGGHVTVLKK